MSVDQSLRNTAIYYYSVSILKYKCDTWYLMWHFYENFIYGIDWKVMFSRTCTIAVQYLKGPSDEVLWEVATVMEQKYAVWSDSWSY